MLKQCAKIVVTFDMVTPTGRLKMTLETSSKILDGWNFAYTIWKHETLHSTLHLWLPLPKSTKTRWITLVTIFRGLVQIFKTKIYSMCIINSSHTFRKQWLWYVLNMWLLIYFIVVITVLLQSQKVTHK